MSIFDKDIRLPVDIFRDKMKQIIEESFDSIYHLCDGNLRYVSMFLENKMNEQEFEKFDMHVPMVDCKIAATSVEVPKIIITVSYNAVRKYSIMDKKEFLNITLPVPPKCLKSYYEYIL